MKAKVWAVVCIVALFSFSLSVNAQVKKQRPTKNSIGKGALFLYWGYNKSVYSKSKMNFVGPGYDFTLSGVKASDRPSMNLKTYFDPKTFSVPQFNIRAGYFFSDNWAINIGYDHMKYVVDEQENALLSGHINPGVDAEWSGDYTNEKVTLNSDHFHYENTNGHNYIHAEIMYGIYLYRTPNKQFAISTLFGAGFGGILSFNDLTFAGKKDMVTISMSGYGLNAQVGVRFEFFNHFFIQSEFSGGLMHQVKVNNRPNMPEAYTRHAFGYGMFQTNIGGIVYIRSKNGCDTCPKW